MDGIDPSSNEGEAISPPPTKRIRKGNRRLIIGAIALALGLILLIAVPIGLEYLKYYNFRLSVWGGIVMISLGITLVISSIENVQAAITGKIKGSPFELLGTAALYSIILFGLGAGVIITELDGEGKILKEVAKVETLNTEISTLKGKMASLNLILSGETRANLDEINMLHLTISCPNVRGPFGTATYADRWVISTGSAHMDELISGRESPMPISVQPYVFTAGNYTFETNAEKTFNRVIQIEFQIVSGIIEANILHFSTDNYDQFCNDVRDLQMDQEISNSESQ